MLTTDKEGWPILINEETGREIRADLTYTPLCKDLKHVVCTGEEGVLIGVLTNRINELSKK